MSQASDPTEALGDFQPDESPVAVADPEEYSQSRRLKAIHDARERVLETRNNILDAQLGQQLNEQVARRYFRQAVENYILEVEPLLTSDDIDAADHYYTEKTVGSFTVNPPRSVLVEPEDAGTQMVPGTEYPEPIEITYTGLREILESDFPVARTFTVYLDVKHEGVDKESETVRTEPPMDVLLRAYRLTNQFLREIDIDATLDATEDEFHADYSDILDEGEPDPRDHVDNDDDTGGDSS